MFAFFLLLYSGVLIYRWLTVSRLRRKNHSRIEPSIRVERLSFPLRPMTRAGEEVVETAVDTLVPIPGSMQRLCHMAKQREKKRIHRTPSTLGQTIHTCCPRWTNCSPTRWRKERHRSTILPGTIRTTSRRDPSKLRMFNGPRDVEGQRWMDDECGR